MVDALMHACCGKLCQPLKGHLHGSPLEPLTESEKKTRAKANAFYARTQGVVLSASSYRIETKEISDR
jgi:hypothetical protein